MKITLDKEIKKELMSTLKKFKANKLVVFFNFNEEDGHMKIRGFRGLSSEEVIELSYRFTHTWRVHNLDRLVLSNLSISDVFFHMILEKEYHMETYHKNLKDMRFKDRETDYWMDTIIVKNVKGTKSIRYDDISFDGVQAIYLK